MAPIWVAASDCPRAANDLRARRVFLRSDAVALVGVGVRGYRERTLRRLDAEAVRTLWQESTSGAPVCRAKQHHGGP